MVRDHPDEWPPWWETTLIRDHHGEKPPWCETTLMSGQPSWQETNRTSLKKITHSETVSFVFLCTWVPHLGTTLFSQLGKTYWLISTIGGSCHKYHFCLKNILLMWQNRSFVVTKVCSLRQKFCRNKHIFVMTNNFVVSSLLLSWQRRLCHNKTCLFSWQKYTCCDKTFVAANIFVARKVLLQQKYFVLTNIILSRQNFSRGMHTFVATKDGFVTTKIILVAAPANDTSDASWTVNQSS